MLGRSMLGTKRSDNVIWKIRVCNSQEKRGESNRGREKLRYSMVLANSRKRTENETVNKEARIRFEPSSTNGGD